MDYQFGHLPDSVPHQTKRSKANICFLGDMSSKPILFFFFFELLLIRAGKHPQRKVFQIHRVNRQPWSAGVSPMEMVEIVCPIPTSQKAQLCLCHGITVIRTPQHWVNTWLLHQSKTTAQSFHFFLSVNEFTSPQNALYLHFGQIPKCYNQPEDVGTQSVVFSIVYCIAFDI